MQQPIALSDGGELRLTIARYYTPCRPLHSEALRRQLR
ncbi:MAG: hypothetical protein WKG07_30690 [Hymenobacter sp.]